LPPPTFSAAKNSSLAKIHFPQTPFSFCQICRCQKQKSEVLRNPFLPQKIVFAKPSTAEKAAFPALAIFAKMGSSVVV